MNSCRAVLFSLLQTLAVAAFADDPQWLIATHSENIASGRDMTVEVVRPSDSVPWPDLLSLRLLAADGSESRVHLQPQAVSGTLRRQYFGRVDVHSQGIVRAELAEVPSNRLALVAEPSGIHIEPLPLSQPITLAPSLTEPVESPEATPQTVVLDETQLPALAVNEPMYFLLGEHGEARFQLSFNYRLFAPDGPVVKLAPFLKGLYFGYTQNAFWDLGEDSKPFRDTSYRPSLFWQGRVEGPRWFPETWKAGYEHESNGKEDEDSRSIDTLFFEPRWQHRFADGSALSFYPRIRAYLDKEENPDIQRYRGYVNWGAQYGWEEGWKLSLNYLQGTSGYATAQFDASYPLGTEVFSNIGSFLHFQYFTGYGETLLNYDERKSDQFRIGISIVR